MHNIMLHDVPIS